MQVEEGNEGGENRDCGAERERLKSQNDYLHGVISRLTTEKNLLDDDYKRVKKKNVELVRDIECLKSRISGFNDSLLNISKQISAPLNSYSKVGEFDSSNARCLSCRSTTPGTSRKSPVLVVSDANFATSGDTTFDDGTVMMCTRLVQLVARNSSVITLLIPR